MSAIQLEALGNVEKIGKAEKVRTKIKMIRFKNKLVGITEGESQLEMKKPKGLADSS